MKKKVIKDNLNEIKETFLNIGGDKARIGLSLLDEVIFMKTTLKELKDKITQDGAVTSMCQGSYDIDRENPALRSYNTMIKNYQSSIKLLNDLLGEQPNKAEQDELDNFLNE